jgi:MFS family permease
MKRLPWHQLITINIYWLALNVSSNSLSPIILPVKVQELVPETLKNSYLGIIQFLGLLVAVVIQPVMGALSDRSRLRWGRRRPFIVAGTLMNLVFLPVIALAGNYWILLVGLLLLQFASNTAHGPLQGLIPDKVPQEQRGTASGVKGLIEIIGATTAALAAGYLVGQGQILLSVVLIMVVFVFAMLITVFTVHEEPLKESPEKSVLATVLSTFNIDIRRYRYYSWWILNRFLFFVGLTVIQTFLLYFIQDVLRLPNPAAATGNLTAALGLAIVAIVFPTGYLADRVGRKPLLLIAGVGATIGGFLFPFANNFTQLMIYGSIIGVSAGVFISAGWALATDLVPHEEAGRYLGISNLATAGGSAVARLGGPFIDFFNARQFGLGYTVVFMTSGVCFLLATLALLKIREVRTKKGVQS